MVITKVEVVAVVVVVIMVADRQMFGRGRGAGDRIVQVQATQQRTDQVPGLRRYLSWGGSGIGLQGTRQGCNLYRRADLCTAETRTSGGRDGAWDGRWIVGVGSCRDGRALWVLGLGFLCV
jgi:hypothetical protein